MTKRPSAKAHKILNINYITPQDARLFGERWGSKPSRRARLLSGIMVRKADSIRRRHRRARKGR